MATTSIPAGTDLYDHSGLSETEIIAIEHTMPEHVSSHALALLKLEGTVTRDELANALRSAAPEARHSAGVLLIDALQTAVHKNSKQITTIVPPATETDVAEEQTA